MWPCPMRCIANSREPLKPMTSTIPQATRAKPQGAGRRRRVADHGGAARSASLAGAITTKIGRRLLRGSAGRGRSSSRRPAFSW
jgi:hypothetical protein